MADRQDRPPPDHGCQTPEAFEVDPAGLVPGASQHVERRDQAKTSPVSGFGLEDIAWPAKALPLGRLARLGRDLRPGRPASQPQNLPRTGVTCVKEQHGRRMCPSANPPAGLTDSPRSRFSGCRMSAKDALTHVIECIRRTADIAKGPAPICVETGPVWCF